MKKKYNKDQQFFVVYARHERLQRYGFFNLKEINNEILGLYDTIENAPSNKLSDGEISKALLNLLNSLYGDDCTYRFISIINWWCI